MNGKGQFYLNVGITMVFGFYGVCSALYSELMKARYEWNGGAIAIDVTFFLLFFTGIVSVLKRGYVNLKDGSE